MRNKSIIQLFKKLCEIDSISGEEKEISSFIKTYLEELGVEVFQDENYMLHFTIGKGEPQLLLCAHLDTVEPGRGIKVIQKDGYLVSAGDTILGGDNKAAVSAILETVRSILTKNVNDEYTAFEVIFSVREETEGGIRDFDFNRVKAKRGLVFDGGDGDLGYCVIAAPYLDDFIIKLYGKSAHASKPERAKNPLDALNFLMNQVKIGRVDLETTLNFGLINGGSATNTTPAVIIIKGDVRSNSKVGFNAIKRDIELTLDKLDQAGFNTEVDWFPYSTGYLINRNHPLVLQMENIYKSHGIKLNKCATTGGSDASYLNSIGITTLCLGDGVEGIHTVEEKIDIKKFLKLQDLIKTSLHANPDESF